MVASRSVPHYLNNLLINRGAGRTKEMMMGFKIDKDQRKPSSRMNVDFPDDMMAALKVIRRKHGIPASEFVRQAVQYALDNMEDE